MWARRKKRSYRKRGVRFLIEAKLILVSTVSVGPVTLCKNSRKPGSKKENLCGVIGAKKDDDRRPGGPITGGDFRLAQVKADQKFASGKSSAVRQEMIHNGVTRFACRAGYGSCDCFEGLVMKRAGSAYSVQLRSATKECRGG
jgi:hypothetical protein